MVSRKTIVKALTHPLGVRTLRKSGTLMWVGERSRPEFRGVFATCEAEVAQLALRSDVHDALSRPASDVACIIVTRQTRNSFHLEDLETLALEYPDAMLIQVLGSLCEGERPRAIEPFGDHTVYWHQCNQFLPDWLRECGFVARANSKPVNSIAIVADTIQIADPLMELAASYGAAAFWCRQPYTLVARNFDAVWWDDSIATPATEQHWRDRIGAMTSKSSSQVAHAWLVSCPRIECVTAAQQAGVGLVVSKPANIDALLQTIAPAAVSDAASNSSSAQETNRKRVA